MEKIKVYSRERCMPCKATVRELGKYGIQHEVIMLEDHPEIRDQLVEEGFMESPAVDTGTDKFSGFRPDRIKELANEG